MYTIYMKKVPLKELKEHLSDWMAEAAAGVPVEITRYNQPYVRLIAAKNQGLHIGSFAGKRGLKSAFKTDPTNGKWLEFLMEDRSED